VHRAFSIRHSRRSMDLIGEPVLPLARIMSESTYAALACSEREGPRLVSRTHADDAPAIQQFQPVLHAHALQNFDSGYAGGRSAALESCVLDQICCRHRRSGI